jgi:hypothetical protein
MRRVLSISFLLIRRKDPKWNLATASTATRVPFGTTIHTATSTARGLVNRINMRSIVVVRFEGGHAEIAGLLDGSHGLSARSNRRLLEAAALAGTMATLTGTFDGDYFGIAIEFVHLHLPVIAGSAKNTRTARIFFQRVTNLVVVDKIFELGAGLTVTTELLQRFRKNMRMRETSERSNWISNHSPCARQNLTKHHPRRVCRTSMDEHEPRCAFMASVPRSIVSLLAAMIEIDIVILREEWRAEQTMRRRQKSISHEFVLVSSRRSCAVCVSRTQHIIERTLPDLSQS